MTRVVALLLACAVCVVAFAGLTAASEAEDNLFDEEQMDFIQLQEQLTQAESVWATIVDSFDEHERSLIQQEAEDPYGAGHFGGSAGVKGGSAGVKGGSAGVKGGSAGVKGGSAGVKGGSAGVKGGSAGVKGGSAGVKGGSAGVKGGSAGVKGGDAGGKDAVVVQRTSNEHYSPFEIDFDPRDKTPNQRVCRFLRDLYIKRYVNNSLTQVNFLNALGRAGGEQLLQYNSFIDSFICLPANNNHAAQIKQNPRVEAFGFVFRNITSPEKKGVANILRSSKIAEHVNAAAMKGKNKDVEHQDDCGSCWAQSAIDSFEIALTKAGKNFTPRSVQQLVDCVYPDKSGCTGGSPMDALKYLMTYGSVDAASYPYTGKVGTCRTSPGGNLYAVSQDHTKSPISTGFDLAEKAAKLTNDSANNSLFTYKPCTDSKAPCAIMKTQFQMEAELLITVQQTGPYIVYVDANNWQHYDTKTLVFPPDKCSADPVDGNHLVQLLGYTVKNDIPVWIVKNSWGPEFGDHGKIYLPIGHNACGIANYVLKATVPEVGNQVRSKPLPAAKMPKKITRNKRGKTKKSKTASKPKSASAKKPVAKKPVAKKPVAKKPVAKKPAVKKSLLQRNATTKLKKGPTPKTKRKVVKRKVARK